MTLMGVLNVEYEWGQEVWTPNGLYREFAVFSPDRAYRYVLTRCVNPLGDGVLLGTLLNPSTAAASINDPTIRRMMGFGRDWGYRILMIGNLFGFRATDPKEMKESLDPIGPLNDKFLDLMAGEADAVMVGWGAHGNFMGRDVRVSRIIHSHPTVFHLGLTKSGQPKHPLYLPKLAKRTLWREVLE